MRTLKNSRQRGPVKRRTGSVKTLWIFWQSTSPPMQPPTRICLCRLWLWLWYRLSFVRTTGWGKLRFHKHGICGHYQKENKEEEKRTVKFIVYLLKLLLYNDCDVKPWREHSQDCLVFFFHLVYVTLIRGTVQFTDPQPRPANGGSSRWLHCSLFRHNWFSCLSSVSAVLTLKG